MTTTYNPAGNKCLGGNQPGAEALRAGVMSLYDKAVDLGIYNCRDTRGGSSLSLHAEGRAWDAGFPYIHPDGTALADLLVEHSNILCIQRVIWNRHEWDNRGGGWEPYTGSDDHTTHLHIELNWYGAEHLTERVVIETLGGDMGIGEDVLAKVGALQAEVTDIKDKTGALQAEVASLHTKIDGLASGSGGLSQGDRAALVDLKASVDALNNRLASP